jgi:hypothetical protein
MPTTTTLIRGYRASDRRVLLDLCVWWTSGRCGLCDHLVWVRKDEWGVGKSVRCTVCLETEDARTER